MNIRHAFFIFFACSAAALLLNPAAGAGTVNYIAAAAEQDAEYSLADRSDHPADNNRQDGSRSWLADTKGAGSADSPRDAKSDLISAEVTDVLSPNEIEVKMLGKNHVIKLAGVKDCPCDFNEQATKMARAETKASKGFAVVDAGTIVKRCRDIRDYLKENTVDEVLIKLSGAPKSSSGRIAGIVRNKGESKTLNDAVLAYAEKQHAIEKKKNEHHTYKKFKAKNGKQAVRVFIAAMLLSRIFQSLYETIDPVL